MDSVSQISIKKRLNDYPVEFARIEIQREALRRKILIRPDYEVLLLRKRPYISGPVVITLEYAVTHFRT